MSPCTYLRDRLEAHHWEEWQLSEEDVQHVRGCADCEREFQAQRTYVDVVAAAREALASEVMMPPEAWSRMRAVAEKTEQRAILEWMLQPALAVAMAAMVFWIALSSPTPESSPDTRLSKARPSHPTRSIFAPVEVPVVEPRRTRTLGPGSVVTSRGQLRELVAFDRHVMELAPRTRVTIVAWNPRRIVLNVTAGSVRAVVKRERDGDHFELRTSHMQARALGTDYRVSIRQQGVTTVRVAHGTVEVTDKASSVTRVQAGEALQVTSRGSIKPPADQAQVEAVEPPEQAAPASPAMHRGSPAASKAPSTDAAPKPAGTATGLKVIEIDIAPQAADPPGGG